MSSKKTRTNHLKQGCKRTLEKLKGITKYFNGIVCVKHSLPPILLHSDLVVTRFEIQLGKHGNIVQLFEELVNNGNRELVGDGHLVLCLIVDVESPCSIFLLPRGIGWHKGLRRAK